MLWKKESRQSDALYIDIFTPNIQHWDSMLNAKLQTIDQKPHPEKSDIIALEKRNDGNEKFRQSSTLKAMELYSDSLRFAKPGSEHISLAYANRSACFLQMKMYDECLIDIDNAIAAGYPEHLRPKLSDRKVRCLKKKQENPQFLREKLNIEANDKFPYVSNVINVQRNEEKDDYSLVATADIDVGQPVVVENPHCTYVSNFLGIFCIICAKECSNLVPCTKCASAMFCSECQGNSLHEHECGLNVCGESEFNSTTMTCLRDILLSLKIFTTADELMVFVEQMLKTPNVLPDSLLDDRSKYQAYFNCPIKESFQSLDQMANEIYPVYKMLLRIPHVSEMYKETKHRRFLMHLIGHHTTIPYFTTGIALDSPSSTICFSSIMRSYIKHSCNSNIDFDIRDGKCRWYSIKPIKKGEQLCISCVPEEINSTKERKKFLMDVLKMKCECSRCQDKMASSAERDQLISDPLFRYIYGNVKSLFPLEFDTKQVESLMEACVTILQEYGQIDWCGEIVYVTKWFQTLYKIRSFGGGSDFNFPLTRTILMYCDGKFKCNNCNVS